MIDGKRSKSSLNSALTVAYAALTRPTYELLAVVMAGYILVIAPAFQWARLRWKEAVSASLLLVSGSYA